MLLTNSKSFPDDLSSVAFGRCGVGLPVERIEDAVLNARYDMNRAEAQLFEAEMILERAQISECEAYEASTTAKAIFHAASDKYLDHQEKRQKTRHEVTTFWCTKCSPEEKALRLNLKKATKTLRLIELQHTRSKHTLQEAKEDERSARATFKESSRAYMEVWRQHLDKGHDPFHWRSRNVVV